MTRLNVLNALLLAAVVTGCSGDDDDSDPKTRLIGKWGADAPGDANCAVAVTFRDDGLYEGDFICKLTDGAFGLEAEVGQYSAQAKTVALTPTHATCIGEAHPELTMAYTVTSTNLRLTLPSGAITFEKLTSDPNAIGSDDAIVRFGCFASDGSFIPSEVAPL